MACSGSNAKVGISACLLGRKVRYDGGHKRQAWLAATLGKVVTWVPICPEKECGLGVPRDPMRLTGNPACPRLVVIRTGRDVTPRMRRWVLRRLKKLANQKLCGFVFKCKSPSCGVGNVRIFDKTGNPVARGVGLFACAFQRRFPDVPVTDEQCLRDPKWRRAFLARIGVGDE